MENETERISGLIDYSRCSVKTGEYDTDLVVQKFGDTLFVVITQLQKIGTLIQIVPEKPLAGETTNSSYEIKVLMGAQANMAEVNAFCRWFARSIGFEGKSVLLSLAIRDWTSTASLRPVVDAVTNILNKTKRQNINV